jgi:hypothetical protein
VSNFRSPSKEEDLELFALLDAFNTGIAQLVKRSPEIRKHVACFVMGSAVGLCDSFGVDAIVEAKRTRDMCGCATELFPPEVN